MPPFSRQDYLDAFTKITNQMVETTAKKNADYSGNIDAFQNFRMVEKLGISDAQTAIMVRMTDKMTRIATLLKQEAQVKEESIEDTLLDLAVYSIILMIYRKHGMNTASQNSVKIGSKIIDDREFKKLIKLHDKALKKA